MRVAVLFYPGCIEYEVMLALELLADHAEIQLLTPERQAYAGRNCIQYAPHGDFKKLHKEAFDCVLIPGGDAAFLFQPTEDMDTEAQKETNGSESTAAMILRTDLATGLRYQAEQGALLAAICAGPLILAAAGLLQNKNYVHGLPYPEPEPVASYFQGQFVDAPLVRDQQLITARPEAHIAFALEILKALKLIDTIAASKLIRYYRGPDEL